MLVWVDNPSESPNVVSDFLLSHSLGPNINPARNYIGNPSKCGGGNSITVARQHVRHT